MTLLWTAALKLNRKYNNPQTIPRFFRLFNLFFFLCSLKQLIELKISLFQDINCSLLCFPVHQSVCLLQKYRIWLISRKVPSLCISVQPQVIGKTAAERSNIVPLFLRCVSKDIYPFQYELPLLHALSTKERKGMQHISI